MISAKFLWKNVLLGGKQQIDSRNSNFGKSVSMPLILMADAPYIALNHSFTIRSSVNIEKGVYHIKPLAQTEICKTEIITT